MNLLTRQRQLIGKSLVKEDRPALTNPTAKDVIDTLIIRTQEKKEQIAAQAAYVDEMRAIADHAAKNSFDHYQMMGVNLPPAVRDLSTQIANDRKQLSEAAKIVEKVKKLIDAGCEPTTPNSAWYCGVIDDNTHRRGAEGWPCANAPFKDQWGDGWKHRQMTYQGPMPVSAFKKLAEVRNLVDEVRVYSPHKSHFEEVPIPKRVDPVLIGRVRHIDNFYFFEIARWDVTDDLAALFTKK